MEADSSVFCKAFKKTLVVFLKNLYSLAQFTSNCMYFNSLLCKRGHSEQILVLCVLKLYYQFTTKMASK